MRSDKLLDFLQGILGPYKEYAKSEYYFICPLCAKQDSKKKLAINLNESNASRYMHWHCWRDSSHSGESIFSLLKKIGVSSQVYQTLNSILGTRKNIDLKDIGREFDDGNNEAIKEVFLPTEFNHFYSGKNRNTPEYKNALMYLVGRKVTAFDIIKNHIGYCDKGMYGGYVVFPSYDENAKLNYFVARSYYDSPFRYRNPLISKNIIFNDIHINWKEKIILTEGVFDAIAIRRNAIPLLGKTMPESLLNKIAQKNVKEICICLDNDAVKQSILHIEYFLNNGITVYFVDLPDKDPSEVGFEKMTELIKRAEIVDFSKLICMKLLAKLKNF